MTSALVVETSVTNNSSFQNYSHPDNHNIRTKEWDIYPSSETQVLLVGRMHFGWATFSARKFFSRAKEPLGTFSYQTSSRGGRNPSRWLAWKFFSGQSTRRSSRVIPSPSYTEWFYSSIDLVAWPSQREDSREKFQNKDLTKKSKSQTVTWELKIEAILFHQFSWRIYRRYIVNSYS